MLLAVVGYPEQNHPSHPLLAEIINYIITIKNYKITHYFPYY